MPEPIYPIECLKTSRACTHLKQNETQPMT
ncbi:hypothetical protein M2401_006681 [Pseudomonas sp. JUb42]|nr:hypothetical protein [Pseudomonas sp. JUb42]